MLSSDQQQSRSESTFKGETMKKILKRIAFIFAFFAATFAGQAVAAEGAPNWGYHGTEGAEKWGDLSKDFATCKLGKEQSPIDIKTAGVEKAKLDKIVFNYQPTKLNIVNNGHTVQVNYDAGSSITIGKDKYELLQYHFHTPSEEEIDGKEFDLVAHLVHKSADGKLAVVAVLFDRGADENKALKAYWDKLPREAGETRSLPKSQINAADMLPANRGYYTFNGSLTTPPCSENVRWLVLKNPVTVSKDQTAAFRKIYPLNNRPVQPLNARKIQVGGE
jgi:carbonic anhydrase